MVMWDAVVDRGRLSITNGRLRAGDVVLLHFTPHLAHDLQVALRAAHRAGLAPASLADYLIPSAADLPSFITDRTITPSTTHSLGTKGVGEAGAIASTPAVMNAIVDALRPMGVNDVPMPASPQTVWRTIQAAGGSK